MFSFKVKEVHRPRELAQLEHKEIIWMMSKTYLKTLTYMVWLEIFHHSRLFTSSHEPIPESSAIYIWSVSIKKYIATYTETCGA